MIIIDSSLETCHISTQKIINQLIYVSYASTILTNIFLVLNTINLNNKNILKTKKIKHPL